MTGRQLAPTLGPLVCDFIESHMVHGPGDVMGRPVVLNDDAVLFLYRLYELRPDGRRRYRRACYSRPKGSAKTELAAFVALVEAFGPAVCAGFDGDGEPVGVPRTQPDIMCLATEEGQAGLAYSVIYYNLTEGPLADTPGLDAGRTRTLLPGNGIIRAGTSGAASKDGLRPTLLVADETHLMTLPELKEMHAVAWRGIYKRSDALLLETTTAFAPGQGSVAESAHEVYRNLTDAEGAKAGVLYDHRGASVQFDALEEPDVRMAALIEAYGPVDYMPLEEIVAAWDLPEVDPVEWARYWANMVVAKADQFMDPADWAAVADAGAALHDGDAVCLGIDTSLVDDGTAVVAVRVSDGHIERLGYWQRPAGRAGHGWTVPYTEVDQCVRGAFDRCRVLRVYSDPQYCQSLMTEWERDFGKKRVHAWYTNRPRQMAAALERFYVAVQARDGISHDGDSLLAQHVGNARTYEAQGRTLVRKEYKHSPRKIDLLMAAVLGFEAAADARAAGEDIAQRKGRVYGYR